MSQGDERERGGGEGTDVSQSAVGSADGESRIRRLGNERRRRGRRETSGRSDCKHKREGGGGGGPRRDAGRTFTTHAGPSGAVRSSFRIAVSAAAIPVGSSASSLSRETVARSAASRSLGEGAAAGAAVFVVSPIRAVCPLHRWAFTNGFWHFLIFGLSSVLLAQSEGEILYRYSFYKIASRMLLDGQYSYRRTVTEPGVPRGPRRTVAQQRQFSHLANDAKRTTGEAFRARR
jgi:hypothetical protein